MRVWTASMLTVSVCEASLLPTSFLKPRTASALRRRRQWCSRMPSPASPRRAGGFGLVIGVGHRTEAATLPKSHADHIVADLSEVHVEGFRIAGARWEHFPHDADIGVRGYGPTIAAAFEQAALALTAVVTDPAHIELRRSVSITCEAPSIELLLVDWLNAVVLWMATDDLVFGAFDVAISGTHLDGRAHGEPVDIDRHQPAVEVKGATLTALEVAEQPDGTWRAQCVVDV